MPSTDSITQPWDRGCGGSPGQGPDPRLSRLSLACPLEAFLLDLDGRVLWHHPGEGPAPGRDPAGLHLWELFSIPAAQLCRRMINLCAQSGKPVSFMAAQAGRLKDWQVRPAAGPEGETDSLAVYCRPARSQGWYERALKAREENLQALLEAMPDMAALVDTRGRLLAVNRPGAAFLGRPAGEAIGQELASLLEPGVLAAWRPAFLRAALSGRTVRRQAEHRGRSLELVCQPVASAEGAVERLVLLAQDLTRQLRAEEARRESELRYRTIFENVTDGISVHQRYPGRQDRRLLDCNPSYADMAGRSKDELLAAGDIRHLQIRYHEEEDSREIQARVEQGRPYGGTASWRRPDGRENFHEFRAVPVRMGERILVFGIDRDITQRVRVEVALKESEERLRVLFESSPDGVAVCTSPRGVISHLNPAAGLMFGYSAEELVGRRLEELCLGPNRRVLEAGLSSLAGSEELRLERVPFLRGDGEIVYVDITASRASFGGDNHFLVYLRDVTQGMITEEALRESEEKFAKLFRISPVSLCILTLEEGRILEVNEALVRFSGLGREKLVGRTQKEVGLWVCQEAVQRLVADLRRRGWVRGRELAVRTAGGGIKTVLASAELSELGNQLCVIAALVDITDRKEAERKLLESQLRLRELNAELALTEARERRELATALHDRVSQNLFMCKFKLSEMRSELTDLGLQQGMADIVSIMDQSLKEARSLTYDLSLPILYDHGLAAALEWLAEDYRKRHGLPVEYRCRDGQEEVSGDLKVLLFRAARELLMNVVKHAGASRAWLELSTREQELLITVADDGRGFDPEEMEREHAFSFGLYSIKERLLGLGGRMQIASEPGRGSRVSLSAPRGEQA
jgi:PAS domain S-box-containing protein